MSATINMADNPATTTVVSSTLSPFTELPAELREMIYQYYCEALQAKQEPKYVRDKKERHYVQWIHNKDAHNFDVLKPYFGVLQLSSKVRSEAESDIYKSTFTDFWFEFKIDSRTNDVKRMKDILTRCQDANRDIKFCVQFDVSKRLYSRDLFFKFVDFFLKIHAKKRDLEPAFVLCSGDSDKKILMVALNTSASNIMYTITSQTYFHRLLMFGTLARLDWSKFGKRR
jgi:hypothetical protein